MPARRADHRQVFINCPFSSDYQEKFDAIVFSVIRSGFQPRCALETDDGTENRLQKICDLIAQCRLSIHDISMTELDEGSQLPRFNMPLELGLFLGAKKFGPPKQRQKRCIILDREPYRYQKFISDIAGQDIHAYGGDADRLVETIATWLRDQAKDPGVPGGRAISRDFRAFQRSLPDICAEIDIDPPELTFKDYRDLAASWIVRAAKDRARRS
ncbi:hypothetical protein [Aestuariivirga sp.]|uniref:hypothetical protein n=1 Tax=Aestuariivirga sp. TaxID=2650926 RepID=UPI0025C65192|nr:hypothetical protein [Aestuariivirga sp.]MCA3554661.1 hypothetical protein [Aestuariivirga sp.]